MVGRDITRRDLLRGVGGCVAASLMPIRSSSAVGIASDVSLVEEFSIKDYNQVLLPRGHGQLTKLTTPITRRYPSRDHCMQMAAFFSDSSGLLVYTKDPLGSVSDWEILPGDKLRIHFYAAKPDIEVKSIPPKIEAAAEYYKEWARQQTWATKRRQTIPSLSLIAVAPNPNMSGQLQSIKK